MQRRHLLLAAAALPARSAFAHHGWSSFDTGRPLYLSGRARKVAWRSAQEMLERVGSKLALDAAQKQKLAQLADTLQAQRKAFMGDAAQPREALQALVAGATFDRAAAQTLVDAKVRAVQAGSPEVIAAMGDFYDSLNPDQQQKVRELMQRRRGWMGRHKD